MCVFIQQVSDGEINKKDIWYTVGFVKGNSYDVHNYFLADDDTSSFTIDSLPDYSNLPRITLEPGTAYKFRVAAINTCGRGEWSEVYNKINKHSCV